MKNPILMLFAVIVICVYPGSARSQVMLNPEQVNQNFVFYLESGQFGRLEHQLFLRQPKDKGQEIQGYSLRANLQLNHPGESTTDNMLLQLYSNLNTDLEGKAISYKLSATAQGDNQSVECDWTEFEIQATARARGQVIRQEVILDNGEPAYILDNNLIGHWSFLSLLHDWKEKRGKWSVHCFVPQTLGKQVYEIEWLEEVQLPDQGQAVCQRYRIHPIDEYLYLNQDGLVVRIEDPRQKIVIKSVEQQRSSD